MSDLAKILGAYGAGHVLSHAGREYTFKAIDQRTKDELGKGYYRRAREAVYAMREEISEGEYQVQLTRVAEQYEAGAYDFPGKCMGYYFSPAGLPELVRAMTGCAKGEADALAAERSLDVMHVCLCVMGDSFPDFKKKALQAEEMGLMKDPKIQPFLRLLASTPQPSSSRADSAPTGSPV